MYELGLIGVFVSNFIGSVTVLLPIPGVGVAGQALIITEAATTNIFLVALVGGIAMTLAEITAYMTGKWGSALNTNQLVPQQGRLQSVARRPAAFVNRIMLRYGIATLFVLSVIPNPVFEFAGIAAGATHMNFWRFLASVGMGKTTRALLLATLGGAYF